MLLTSGVDRTIIHYVLRYILTKCYDLDSEIFSYQKSLEAFKLRQELHECCNNSAVDSAPECRLVIMGIIKLQV